VKRIHIIASLVVHATLGCSRADRTPLDPLHFQVTESSVVRLSVSDAPASMGLALVRPEPQGGAGEVVVVGLRYGSLCNTAVSGRSDMTGTLITISITYEERLASCTKEVRLLTYRAEVLRLAPGEYDVNVVHSDSANHTEGELIASGRVVVH